MVSAFVTVGNLAATRTLEGRTLESGRSPLSRAHAIG
jgi:hypothetical protein